MLPKQTNSEKRPNLLLPELGGWRKRNWIKVEK